MVKKMLNNGNKKNCGFADEIVAYIYDEIGTPERGKFETHLADCSMCTDEFAAVSNARFSVFEWRREEFAHLPTPEIVVPYSHKSVEENAYAGFFAGLWEFLSISRWPVAVAAVLAVFLGVGFVGMIFLGQGEDRMAVNAPKETAPSVALPVVPLKAEPIPEIVELPTSKEVGSPSQPRPAKALENNRRRTNRQTASSQRQIAAIPDRRVKPQVPNAPVLRNYSDETDKSLRLTDLFEEVGGGLY